MQAISDMQRDTAFKAPIYLNVYDLTTLNNYLYWFGLGIFHSAVEINGIEYAYGAHDMPTSGIFQVEPRSCPGFVFRRSILLGTTELSPPEFWDVMDELAILYTGDSYNLLTKNCNHFTSDLCVRLTKRSSPAWVNRLASLGDGEKGLLGYYEALNNQSKSYKDMVKHQADEIQRLSSLHYEDQKTVMQCKQESQVLQRKAFFFSVLSLTMLAELPPSPLAFLLISSFKIEPLTPSMVKLGLFDNETTNVFHESGKVISKKMAFSL
ncbi:hypothetical protein L7F22_053599 [Adiantum nelumboides]|nr:hypothetical protein [Adiantum nelumboides]